MMVANRRLICVITSVSTTTSPASVVSIACSSLPLLISSWESTAYNTDGRFIMAAAMLAVPLSVMGAKRLADRREQLERA